MTHPWSNPNRAWWQSDLTVQQRRYRLCKDALAHGVTSDELGEVVALADAIPCESVHNAGAPCLRCNPTRVGPFSTGPDYGELRLTAAREVLEAQTPPPPKR